MAWQAYNEILCTVCSTHGGTVTQGQPNSQCPSVEAEWSLLFAELLVEVDLCESVHI